ncbi:MAG TPA: thioredoxin domain-containing protein [Anaerolineaceae bacterium]|nr:thioredoxin domain-containing protein [Anaerolineaceae bacterium]
MANRLIHETSPYLLQHAQNPVDWYPWGEEAFERARSENKPLFVSIGYAACHWCHVMEHESFENPATAELLNRFFVSIKVDREERPDIDMIYMQAVISITGQGGWPLSVFMTPEGKPFYGGTYFPPTRRYGMPAFQDVLNSLAKMWHEEPEKLVQASDQLYSQVKEEVYWTGKNKETSLKPNILQIAAQDLLSKYDWENGGWGAAPRFPAPMTIEFLLTQARRGNQECLQAARHALSAMQQGGMYDLIGGGFHRYSTDDHWLVPHFEKMLYDNAQLASTYLHAYQITGDQTFRRITEETLDFIIRELTSLEGGFYSSLDADSENEEGKYYTWTIDELRKTIDRPEDFSLFEKAFQLPRQGNFEGKIVLRSNDSKTISEQAGISIEEFRMRAAAWKKALFEKRTQRIRPVTDDKVLVSWNALALQAFAEAGRVLDRKDYLEAARRNARFLLVNLLRDGRLYRSWRAGTPRHNGTLEDYAGLIVALTALYQTDFDPVWYRATQVLAEEMIRSFADPEGGFYLVRQDQNDLAIRPKDLQDSATASGSALAVQALLLLAEFNGNSDWFTLSEKTLVQVQDIFARYPTSFSAWLKAFDFAIGPVHQIAWIWPKGNAIENSLLSDFQKQYQPRTVTAAADYPLSEAQPEILFDRPPMNEKLTVYICHGFICNRPLVDAEQISDSLSKLE